MPPRFVIALIVIFWLGVTGWAAWRTMEPYLRTNDPPPFVIDLADESGQRTHFWSIRQNNKIIGVAESKVSGENGLFVIGCSYRINLGNGPLAHKAEVVNRYHVRPDKKLQRLSAEVKLGPLESSEPIIKGLIEGPIQDGFYKPTGEIELAGRLQKVSFDPLDLSGHSTVVNPLHPVNRIDGLRPGRTWQVPLFDPLALISSAKIEGKPDEPLVATVLGLLKSQQGEAK